jgi:hypothetical protein
MKDDRQQSVILVDEADKVSVPNGAQQAAGFDTEGGGKSYALPAWRADATRCGKGPWS